MMKEIIIDTWVNNDCTLGRMALDGFHCFTLELPWKNNENGISCIPDGSYRAAKYVSPKLLRKYGDEEKATVIMLQDVPGRKYIQIHSGNFTYQINGCVLVGDGIKYLDGDDVPDVTNSRNMLDQLLSMLPDDGFIVTINRKF